MRLSRIEIKLYTDSSKNPLTGVIGPDYGNGCVILELEKWLVLKSQLHIIAQ